MNQRVTVIVPNVYLEDTTAPSIPNQYFLDGTPYGLEYGAFDSGIDGSYGFSITGVVGDTRLLSAYPDPDNNLLKIASAPLGGLSYSAVITAIQNSLRNVVLTNGGKVVLNTSFTYVDDDFSRRDRTWRAIDALRWRSIGSGSGFLHVTAVGDLGDSPGAANHARYSSPFSVSEAFQNLGLLVLEDPNLDTTLASSSEFLFLRSGLGDPPPLENLLVVGSSRLDGFTRSDFSTPGADVRMIGEDVTSVCFTTLPPCTEGKWTLSSTDWATAQISALAAWMLNLDPTQSEIIDIIKHVYQNGQLVGIVDAYAAMLTLDREFTDHRIRRAILDVASGGGGAPDGVFDDHDIDVWVNAVFPDVEDGLDFDLNGDGKIGGSDTVWFDLDVNELPVYTTVTQTIRGVEKRFNEEAVTDFDVLCYYAYSDLFSATGDTARRDELLGDSCGVASGGEIIFDGLDYEMEAQLDCGDLNNRAASSNHVSDLADISLVLDPINSGVTVGNINRNGASVVNSVTFNNVPATGETTFSINSVSKTGTDPAGNEGDCSSSDADIMTDYDFEISGAPVHYEISGNFNITTSTKNKIFTAVLLGRSTNPVYLLRIPESGGNFTINESGTLPDGGYSFRYSCLANADNFLRVSDVETNNSSCDVTLKLTR